jgi:virginiamycin B lyase
MGPVTTSGEFSEFSVPTPLSAPFGITSGPDGALWFTEQNAAKIGRVTTSGVFTEFSLPRGYGVPHAITTGPDGAVCTPTTSARFDA